MSDIANQVRWFYVCRSKRVVQDFTADELRELAGQWALENFRKFFEGDLQAMLDEARRQHGRQEPYVVEVRS